MQWTEGPRVLERTPEEGWTCSCKLILYSYTCIKKLHDTYTVLCTRARLLNTSTRAGIELTFVDSPCSRSVTTLLQSHHRLDRPFSILHKICTCTFAFIRALPVLKRNFDLLAALHCQHSPGTSSPTPTEQDHSYLGRTAITTR